MVGKMMPCWGASLGQLTVVGGKPGWPDASLGTHARQPKRFLAQTDRVVPVAAPLGAGACIECVCGSEWLRAVFGVENEFCSVHRLVSLLISDKLRALGC